MTGMMVEIGAPGDVRKALSAGADMIYAGERPGTESPDFFRAAVRQSEGRVPVATWCHRGIGMKPPLPARIAERSGAGFVFVNLDDSPKRLHEAVASLGRLASTARLVGVLPVCDPREPHSEFDDAYLEILTEMKEAGFAGASLSPIGAGASLPEWLPYRKISEFTGRCRTLGLSSILDGMAGPEDCERMKDLEPDFLFFRTEVLRPVVERTIRVLDVGIDVEMASAMRYAMDGPTNVPGV